MLICDTMHIKRVKGKEASLPRTRLESPQQWNGKKIITEFSACRGLIMTNEELVHEYQAGNREAIEQLYLQNSGMIEKIVRRYSGAEELEDLRQESFFGLVKAAELWNPEKGASFLTYAIYWIRAVIGRYIEECGGVVRIPSYKRALIGRYHKARNSYHVLFGSDPSDWELCAALDITKDQLKELKADVQSARIRSTSELIGGENDELTLEDMLADEADQIGDLIEKLQHEELKAELWACVDELKPNESAVIRGRYKNERTLMLKECGDVLGVSQERARQIEAAALRKLRTPRYARRLLPYLEESAARDMSLRGTGHAAFERTGSVQERAMMRLEEWAGMSLYNGVKFPDNDVK